MKRFTPFVATLGLVAALTTGSGAVAAAAGKYSCSNGVNNVVSCNDIIDKVVVKITGKRSLIHQEIVVLKNNLNNAGVDAAVIKNVVVVTYQSFNPAINISVGDVQVCVASVCG
ncbi:hypothetical protein [Saccharothrix sp.]|uniref:hypothetical protein n=1 Tax=Saccharothrix sp. TaxID=1873460 RepID=UPI00281138D7|nr:hypothetical protein [Saccharothrix sp.]